MLLGCVPTTERFSNDTVVYSYELAVTYIFAEETTGNGSIECFKIPS
jgi:hypothetical protein